MGSKGRIYSRSQKKGQSKKKQFSKRECSNMKKTLEKIEEDKETWIDQCASVNSRASCRKEADLTFDSVIEDLKSDMRNCPKK